jgi:heme A synthase
MASPHLAWALLTIGVALWALPLHRQPFPSPAPLTAFAAAGLAGLYCALVAGALAG